jgi:hypothetical protein
LAIIVAQLQELGALEAAVLVVEAILALMALQTQVVAEAVLGITQRLMAVTAALVS